MPGSHIPIVAPYQLKNLELDYLLILPWNISTEIITQNMDLKRRGVKFVTAVPDLEIL